MILGTLYIVATPIGNLEDITLRAIRILKEVDYVLCEDTRLTKRILDKYQINITAISYHQHSHLSKINQILEYLKAGKNLALVSDAGTPGISDPGSALIAAAFKEFGEDLNISPVPGPSAVISALSITGWSVDRFSFFGFLPHKKGRQTMIKEVLASQYPVAFYESKHRLAKCLSEIDFFSKEQGIKVEIMIARELTKMFETIYFGSPEELLSKLDRDLEMQKGEFVICLRQVK